MWNEKIIVCVDGMRLTCERTMKRGNGKCNCCHYRGNWNGEMLWGMENHCIAYSFNLPSCIVNLSWGYFLHERFMLKWELWKCGMG
mgnify:CR=1 FL=1